MTAKSGVNSVRAPPRSPSNRGCDLRGKWDDCRQLRAECTLIRRVPAGFDSDAVDKDRGRGRGEGAGEKKKREKKREKGKANKKKEIIPQRPPAFRRFSASLSISRAG